MDTLLRRIFELAEESPDRPCIACREEVVTYGELAVRIRGIAARLKEEGVEPGDRVCLLAVSRPDMTAAYMGIQLCGAVAVFIDKIAKPENAFRIYEASEAVLYLTDKPMKEYADRCRVLPLRRVCEEAKAYAGPMVPAPSPDPEDFAEILFTSGTTGTPKGVVLSYRAVYRALMNTATGVGILPEDRVVLPLPLNHSFGLRELRAVLYRGGMVVLQNGFTFATALEENIRRFGCTGLAAVPASYEVIRGQMGDRFAQVMGCLRYIEFGAGSLSGRQRQELSELLPNTRVVNTYGASEAGGTLYCDVREVVKDPAKIGMLGRPVEGVTVRILDPSGEEMQSDAAHPGRMSVRGEMVMSGYWKQPELTAEVLKDGWYLTGDMAYQDADGDIFMLGRADDLINVGGEKVSPIEVETVAGQYPSIRECACVGMEDPRGMLGEIPVLFYVPAGDYREDEFLKFMTARIERFKIPQRLVPVEKIPRNRMQKVDRRALKAQGFAKSAGELMNPVIQTILGRRSIRSFTDQEIPREMLDMILKAGYYAPSGHNLQSWRFTVLTRKEDIARLKEAAKEACLREKVNFYGFNNPRVIVLVSNDSRNPQSCQDASAAAENIMLAARSYGLGSVWLNPLRTLRDAEPVKSLLDEWHVPGGHIVWAAVALGWPVSEGVLLAKKEGVVTYIG